MVVRPKKKCTKVLRNLTFFTTGCICKQGQETQVTNFCFCFSCGGGGGNFEIDEDCI